MRSAIVLWLVSHMLSWVALPPAKVEAMRDRYTAIANDALDVANEPTEEPLFNGPLARTRTAALMLAIASFESGFQSDVEAGKNRGDHGTSWCLMQINIGNGRIAIDDNGSFHYGSGWSGPDLAADRKKCFRAALHMARTSVRKCGNLTMYTTNRCYPDGERTASNRAKRERLMTRDEGWTDQGVLASSR